MKSKRIVPTWAYSLLLFASFIPLVSITNYFSLLILLIAIQRTFFSNTLKQFVFIIQSIYLPCQYFFFFSLKWIDCSLVIWRRTLRCPIPLWMSCLVFILLHLFTTPLNFSYSSPCFVCCLSRKYPRNLQKILQKILQVSLSVNHSVSLSVSPEWMVKVFPSGFSFSSPSTTPSSIIDF